MTTHDTHDPDDEHQPEPAQERPSHRADDTARRRAAWIAVAAAAGTLAFVVVDLVRSVDETTDTQREKFSDTLDAVDGLGRALDGLAEDVDELPAEVGAGQPAQIVVPSSSSIPVPVPGPAGPAGQAGQDGATGRPGETVTVTRTVTVTPTPTPSSSTRPTATPAAAPPCRTQVVGVCIAP